MPTYRTPGVYKEEIFLAPAAELRTGVPAFLGFARERLLFSTKLEFQSELDSESISQDLRQEFTNNGISLSQQDVALSIEKEGSEWLITDKGNQQTYLIRKEKEKLNVYVWLPVNTPQMLTLWPQFEEKFGAPLSDSYLAYAVRGFFENGGNLCYVVRLDDTAPAEEALREGLAALASLDTVDLICAPDIIQLHQREELAPLDAFDRIWREYITRLLQQWKLSPDPDEVLRMQAAVLKHCETLGDRFAILDSLPDADVDEVLQQRQGLSGTNGALYYPWIRVLDGPDSTGGFVPPCGHGAAVYARSDQRIGIHKAPANEILEGVLDLEVNLTNAQQDLLNPEGVNCLRAFPGRGIRVWGARTLSGDPAWTYVNVRRLFLTAGRWIERNMSGAVFEPNEPRLWARIGRELTAYFHDLFKRGALKGRTAQEAFYVKCDAETNPPEVQEAGMVVTEIGLAPAVPSEFVVVRIIHGASGVTIAGPTRPE